MIDPIERANAALGLHPDHDSHVAVKDPVCGMTVVPETAAGSVDHDGRTYYFCSRHCVEKFRADPARFLADRRGGGAGHAGHGEVSHPPAAGTLYTCPMDPQVISDHPGACPICGMALEPLTVSAADADVDPELVDMSRRFWISLALTVPLLLLSMAEMVPGLVLPRFLSGPALIWVQLALATPVVIWGGLPFFRRGWASLVNRRLNMFTLIALGTGTAYAFSVVVALFPSVFPASFRDHHGEIAVYFEPAAAIVTLVLLGQVLELRARRQTGSRDSSACSGSPPRPRGGWEPMVTKRRSPSTESSPAIGSGFARGRNSRLTESSSKGKARSTNR